MKLIRASNRRLVGGVVLVLAALGMAPLPMASASVTPVLKVNQDPAIHGELVNLDGALPGPARPVKVRQRVDGGPWTVVSSGRTGRKGAFHLQTGAPGASAGIVSFRVVASKLTVRGKTWPQAQTPTDTIQLTKQYGTLEAPARVTIGQRFALRAAFYPARAGRSVVLQKRTGTRWTKVGTPVAMDANGGATFKQKAGAAHSTVRYRAVAAPVNKAPGVKSSSRAVQIVGASDDVTAPAAPADVSAILGDGVTVSWSAVVAGDLAGYRVYRAETEHGPWMRQGDRVAPPSTEYVEQQTADRIDYWYAVTSVDDSGNESDRSAPALQPSDLDSTPPAAPTGLNAIAGANGEVGLTWNAVSATDLFGYHVERRTAGTDWSRLTTAPHVGPGYSDTTADLGTTYSYRVLATDQTGNESNPSTTADATPTDRTPPPAPTGLNVTNGDSKVDLTWEAVADTDGDLAGYHVERRISDGEWTPLTAEPVSTTAYTDNEVANGTVYRYRVVAVDSAGNDSEPSSPVEAAPEAPVKGNRLDSGYGHTCRIRNNGALFCWGMNDAGRLGDGTTTDRSTPTQVGTATDWVAVSAGGLHTCGIRRSGTLWCWGWNLYGQLGDDTTTNRTVPVQVGFANTWTTVDAGMSQTCAIQTDGTLWCWGSNEQLEDGTVVARPTPVQVGTNTSWATVSTGSYHICGTQDDGTLWCWGANWGGQLGDGTTTDRALPVQVGTDSDWATVTTGQQHTCATRTGGTLWCWGYNYWNALGDGTTTDRPEPVQIGNETTWATVSAGYNHTCGTQYDGALWCWGRNYEGQVGDGSTTYRTTPTRIGTESWSAVTTGTNHSCAQRSDGTVWCWGSRHQGRLGEGRDAYETTPRQISDSLTWRSVDAGTSSTCALQGDGALWCAGYNEGGQLGNGSTTRSTTGLSRVAGDVPWRELSTGAYHSCATRADGTLWCWGYNYQGQLGDGTTTTRPTPVQVGTDTTWSSVSAGFAYSCGIHTTGTLWCWGYNDRGQVGIGSPGGQQPVPTQIGTNSTWATVSAGANHTCATRTDGTLWCWGNNDAGQLGDASGTQQNAPTQIGADTTWSTVATGTYHTCATRTDGTLWCWGVNWAGQLGDGTTTQRTQPTQVGTDTTWSTVTAGTTHTCATRTGGTLWCWGYNGYSQLGDGTTTQRTVPTQIGTDSTWSTVTGGEYHTCGTRANGSLSCWGWNASDQLGFFNGSAIPVRVLE